MSVEHRHAGHPSTGNGSVQCFKVEARVGLDLPPMTVADQTFDGVWRAVHFTNHPLGVPVRLWSREAEQQGFLTHAAGMAMAYWLAAIADASALEIRLVEYKFTYSYSSEVVGVDDPIVHGVFEYQARAAKKAKTP